MTDPQGSDPVNERLTRLEEATGFAEHTADRLSEEIIDLRARLEALASRLQRLEARLGEVGEAVEKHGNGDDGPFPGGSDDQ
jgi:uncharacterized coiled-coil protein SlyX